MEREETKKIIRIMCDSYPNFKPSNVPETIDVWNMMLSEYTYSQISVALKSYILSDTGGFAPSIGQLVGMVHSIEKPQTLNEMEAWAIVSKAIRNSSYHYVEEFLKLPPEIQRAVGTPEQLKIWAMDEEYNETVVMSNFQRSYRAQIVQNANMEKLPQRVRTMIESNENPERIAMQERINSLAISLMEKSKLLASGGDTEERNTHSGVIDSVRSAVMDSLHAELERIKSMKIQETE